MHRFDAIKKISYEFDNERDYSASICNLDYRNACL
jgi:hypothetical protein